jgi:hypothetical protein
VGLGNVARLSEHQRHCLLGGGDDVRLRCVDDHDAELRRGRHVDVVESDPSATDDDEVCPRAQNRGVHSRRGPNDQGVRAQYGRREVLGRETELDVDLVTGAP